MIEKVSAENYKLHRFELLPNHAAYGAKSTFFFYGIIVVPSLLGSILIYFVFQWRGETLALAFSIMFILLLNIFFFLKIVYHKSKVLRLIVNENTISIFDRKQVYLKSPIRNIKVEKLQCGEEAFPAIKISSPIFRGVVIGAKMNDVESDSQKIQKLALPEYWLKDKNQWEKLIQLLDLEGIKTKL